MSNTKKITGWDVDGVLASFNSAYIHVIKQVTGRNLFPDNILDIIPTWEYPQWFSYTAAEIKAVWKAIEADPSFWSTLAPLPDMTILSNWGGLKHTQYFITNRPGTDVQWQTAVWLKSFGIQGAVIVTDSATHKAEVGKALRLDIFVDDRYENCATMVEELPSCHTYLIDKTYNQVSHESIDVGYTRVKGILEVLKMEGLI